jgi:flagellar biosynthetic protein FlhB
MAREERTEKATPKHRKRARERGQVARSADLSGSLVMVAGLLVVSITAPAIAEAGAASFRAILADIARPGRATSAAGLNDLMHRALSTVEITVGPIAGACLLAALVAGVAQVGGRPTPQALKPDFRRINPVSGLRNLLGPNLIFESLKAIAKVAVVGAVATLTILPGMNDLAGLVGVPPAALASIAGHRALGVAQHAAFAYIAIGLLDYLWKRLRHERQLRMTKQEVKDEVRQYGVSSEVRAALRRRQMQIARARMMAAVPSADVVVTNPTHFAVALRYDGTRTAPEVVAKGQDLIAAQIRRVAEEHDVPVIADPPLARTLHGSTEVGQTIPEELYAAVARVLAFVYKMAGRAPAPARGAARVERPRLTSGAAAAPIAAGAVS